MLNRKSNKFKHMASKSTDIDKSEITESIKEKNIKQKDEENDKISINKKEQKKNHKVLKVLLIIFLIIIIICLIGYFIFNQYLNHEIGKVQYKELTANELGIDETTQNISNNNLNIALLGIDALGNDYGEGNRTDCIIIANINQTTNEVKLFSIYRDTYVQMELDGKTILDKINHAYYNGVSNTLKTINTNLDLDISKYILVNFQAVADLVDEVGGVEITINSDELQYMNAFTSSVVKETENKTANYTYKTGKQTLNGVQAVAYSRIRYTAGKDYKRTERMRTVVEAVVQKAQSEGFDKELELIKKILPETQTNMTATEIKSLLSGAVSWKLVSNFGWPYNTKGIWMDGDFYGPAVTLESNVIQLHKEVFNENDYQLPDKIKDISNQIIAKTGYK